MLPIIPRRLANHSKGVVSNKSILSSLSLKRTLFRFNSPLIASPVIRAIVTRSYSQHRGTNPWSSRSNKKFNQLIPDPLKVLIGLVGTASLLFVVAAPLLFVILPPILLGGYFTTRLRLRRTENQMQQRWQRALSSSLKFTPRDDLTVSQIELSRAVLDRLVLAVDDNEQHLKDILGLKVDQDGILPRLALGEVGRIEYDSRYSLPGVEEILMVLFFPLTDGKHKLANVIVSLAGNSLSPSESRKMVLEIQAGNFVRPVFITNDRQFEDDLVIDVKGKTTTRD
ncbi:BA75_00473T0 [Komagataella pastoris]|uniref:BA75_00473T0 n=1 Tax=Komagataella pastoris TaxID=4922 RepID=A0A1B2J5V4_PICPA|nr:BA75_00473T0 [Komagataella pastoris]